MNADQMLAREARIELSTYLATQRSLSSRGANFGDTQLDAKCRAVFCQLQCSEMEQHRPMKRESSRTRQFSQIQSWSLNELRVALKNVLIIDVTCAQSMIRAWRACCPILINPRVSGESVNNPWRYRARLAVSSAIWPEYRAIPWCDPVAGNPARTRSEFD